MEYMWSVDACGTYCPVRHSLSNDVTDSGELDDVDPDLPVACLIASARSRRP